MLDELKAGVQNAQQNKVINMPSAGPFSRWIAFAVDSFLLSVARILIALVALIPIEPMRLRLVSDATAKFGPDIELSLYDKEQLRFFLSSDFFIAVLWVSFAMVVVGVIYHYIMLSSSWQATVGQRLARIYVTNNYRAPLKQIEICARVLLSYAQWLMPALILSMWNSHTIIALILLLVLCFWSDTFLFTGQKLSIHDLLTGTVVTTGKLNAKFILFKRQ